MKPLQDLGLRTERLLLRPYREGDWLAVHEFAADPEVSRYQEWGPNTEEETRRFVRDGIEANRAADPPAFVLAITLRQSGRLIGGCNLRITRPAYREAMIGYTLGSPWWGRGFATEAARALLRFGFQEQSLHRVVAWCTPDNVGSWRVMEKIGMRREGHEREAEFWKGSWRDWYRYALLDHEWREQNPEGTGDPEQLSPEDPLARPSSL